MLLEKKSFFWQCPIEKMKNYNGDSFFNVRTKRSKISTQNDLQHVGHKLMQLSDIFSALFGLSAIQEIKN